MDQSRDEGADVYQKRRNQIILSGRQLKSLDVLDQYCDDEVQDIFIDNNSVSEVLPLPPVFSKLKQLDLSNNHIVNLTHNPFRFLFNLRVLNLSKNSISYVEGLSCLLQLEWLNLSQNLIHDLTGVENLHNLRILNVSQNELEGIGNLNTNINLQDLDVSCNNIATLDCASDLLPKNSLESLNLSRNFISSIKSMTFLSGLNSLRKLFCDDNPFIIESIQHQYNFRSFLCFVLPSITSINGLPTTPLEIDQGQKLFCDEASVLSQDLLNLLDDENDQSISRYLSIAAPPEDMLCKLKYPGYHENLDCRSSSTLITVIPNQKEGQASLFYQKIESLNLQLLIREPSTPIERWSLRGVAATVIQSHWRRKRILQIYNDYVKNTTCRNNRRSLEARVTTLEAQLNKALQELSALKRTLNLQIHVGGYIYEYLT
uniref:Uncharacterized protein n=1 Tax=Spongospora subterranea TaxID=70186 RepID=A0A0H5QLW6_9EUKA|eukprot:CRZ03155.1 hypothetical protein [Spongospora subterranea]